MGRGLSDEELGNEWSKVPKDWYHTYQWGRLSQPPYVESIAQLLLRDFATIALVQEGLRESNFRLAAHRGQAELNTDIDQLTEKRVCRAIFNARHLPELGTILDYEVPLKRTQAAEHGDVDLVCFNGKELILVEAKKEGSQESILKALLEAFVYSRLVKKAQPAFCKAFGIRDMVVLVPAVLTFESAASAKQLLGWKDLTMTNELLQKLNGTLRSEGLSPIRVFVMRDIKELRGLPFDEAADLVMFPSNYVPSVKLWEP
jgi:hypothetical protein